MASSASASASAGSAGRASVTFMDRPIRVRTSARTGPARTITVQGLRRTSPMVAARPGIPFVAAGGLEGFRGAELSQLVRAGSHVEAELYDVAVAHDVVLALDPHLAGGPGRLQRAGGHQVIE